MFVFSLIWRFFRFLSQYIFFTFILILGVYLIQAYWPRGIKAPTVLVMKLENAPLRERPDPLLYFLKQPLTMDKIRKALMDASKDPLIKGLALELYGTEFGAAQVEEIRELLRHFRKQGKFVRVFCDTLGETDNALKAYYLATIADQISLMPQDHICLTGVSLQHMFLKPFLERHKLKVEVERRSEYKGAPDMFLGEEYSEPVRQNLGLVLDDMLDHVIEGIAAERKLSTVQVRMLVDQALITSEQGIDAKLIDILQPLDAFYHEIEKEYDLLDIRHYTSSQKVPAAPLIGVIYLEGDIMRHRPRARGVITDRLVQKYVDHATKDGVRALVIRVNSRGGSATASKTINRIFRKTREQGIPVVVSFGDISASGGYMIGIGGDKIIAEPTTITGSIGVFFVRPYTKDAWKEFAIHWDTISRGKEANLFSRLHELEPEQKDKLSQMVDQEYENFVQMVSEARNLDPAHVRSQLAGGRVWSGRRALEQKLVDGLGGLDTAIQEAARLADLPAYRIREYPDFQDMFQMLSEGGMGSLLTAYLMQNAYQEVETLMASEQGMLMRSPC